MANYYENAGTTAPNPFPTTPQITSATIAPSTQIQLPLKPPDTTNYTGMVTGGSTTLAANNTSLTQPPPGWDAATYANFKAANPTLEPTPEDTKKMQSAGSSDSLKAFMDTLNVPPPSASDQYTSDYAASGIDQKQTDYNTANKAVLDAQAKYKGIDAQLQGLTAEAQAIPIQTQEDATGRGVTAAGLAPITAAKLRENALKALPLQAQALTAQAEVAAAQGNAQLSQSILQQAQDHLDKVYQIHLTDATNQYNYQKDLRDKVYQYATAQEKTKLDAQQKKDDQAFTLATNSLNNAQALAKTAIDNGQGGLAGKILALDPKSPTYSQDVSALAGQISQKKDLQFISGTENQAAGYFDKATGTFTPLGGRSGGSSEGNTINVPGVGTVDAGAAAFAQHYASTGVIPSNAELKSAHVTFAQVADLAKSLPKTEGMILDRSTGIAPSSAQLSNSQTDGISALYDLTKKLDQAQTMFDQYNHGVLAGTKNYVFPSKEAQQYNDLRLEISDLLARARTGAAINTNEERIYNDKLPGDFNSPFFAGANGTTKIQDLKKSLEGKLQTSLNSNGVAINGYTQIKLADGNQYTVGAIVQNASGQQGRVNADGSITPLQ